MSIETESRYQPEIEKTEKPNLTDLYNSLKEAKTTRGQLLKEIRQSHSSSQKDLPQELIDRYNQANDEVHKLEKEMGDALEQYQKEGWSLWEIGGQKVAAKFTKIPKGDLITFRVDEVVGEYDGLKPGAHFVNIQLETAPRWAREAVEQGVFVFHGYRQIGKNGKTREIPIPDEVYAAIEETK